MTNTSQLLMDEHRRIERVLYALETFAGRVRDNQVKDAQADLLGFVEFVQEFADRCHHGKEEDILFVEMIKAGFPKEEGPLAVMYMEHEEGRALVRKMKELGQLKSWTPEDRNSIVNAALSFVPLLRAHIQKEDECLYPMADERMGENEINAMEKQFEAFEQEETAKGTYKHLHQLGDRLCNEYGSPKG